jgi:hypothetical protein
VIARRERHTRIRRDAHAPGAGGETAGRPRLTCSLLHVVPRGDPRFDAALERAHALQPLVHQHAGDTRRAGFVRSRTVDDDVAVWRQLRHVLVEIMDVDGNGAGHAPRINFPRRLGAHIDDDGRRSLLH